MRRKSEAEEGGREGGREGGKEGRRGEGGREGRREGGREQQIALSWLPHNRGRRNAFVSRCLPVRTLITGPTQKCLKIAREFHRQRYLTNTQGIALPVVNKHFIVMAGVCPLL